MSIGWCPKGKLTVVVPSFQEEPEMENGEFGTLTLTNKTLLENPESTQDQTGSGLLA